MARRGLSVLCAAKLHANQLERHLELFERLDEVERILVVRREPLPKRLSKLDNRTFPRGSRASEALHLIRTIDRCLREERVDWIVGFNPVPWGSLALLPAKARRVPVCLSLIGMDYLQVQKPWGKPFLEAVRRADAITVTGQRMTEGLVARGVARDRIHVLPHSVDIDRFRPSSEKRFDVISTGQLIARKRMDLVLEALAILKRRGHVLSLAILGKGPLREELEELARRLGISEQVTFLGYRDDVENIVASARVFCLASEWEGVPFAMMEAMAAGLPPVVTDVGTIADWVSNGDNGRVIPPADAEALAEALEDVLIGPNRSLEAMAARLIEERGRLSFPAGAAVWREIIAPDG